MAGLLLGVCIILGIVALIVGMYLFIYIAGSILGVAFFVAGLLVIGLGLAYGSSYLKSKST